METLTPTFRWLLDGLRSADDVTALLAALGLEVHWTPENVDDDPLRVADSASLVGWSTAEPMAGLRCHLLEWTRHVDLATLGRAARVVQDTDPFRRHLFICASDGYRHVAIACSPLEGELRCLRIDRDHVHAADVETLEEMRTPGGEGALAVAMRWERALDRTRVSRRFFAEFRSVRERLAGAWRGVPERAEPERRQLALLLLSRLLFLYFLQCRGQLAGDRAYLRKRASSWQRSPGDGSFYRAVIVPLFFGALNRRPADRDAAARALGDLPYLNGGLFERVAVERRFRHLDLPDDALFSAFDELFERFRFTIHDEGDDVVAGIHDLGVNPEMLGRVFEGLMAESRRSETGTFYTPAPIVDRLVCGALAAHLAGRTGLGSAQAAALVREARPEYAGHAVKEAAAAVAGMRILDPACGSGAFLLGAMARLTRLRGALSQTAEPVARRSIVASSLYGVDVQEDAALLCALRLWLALAVGAERTGAPVPPLPNLDRRVRQGDALLDPLDLLTADAADGGLRSAAAAASVRHAARALEAAAQRYITAEPETRPAVVRELRQLEATLAREWLDAARTHNRRQLREAEATASERDLWMQPTRAAREAGLRVRRLTEARQRIDALRAEVRRRRALPFFSFDVHFAEAARSGFDVIVSNPPWVRAHRWPASLGLAARMRYRVVREAGWPKGAELSGAPAGAGTQVDLSLLFLERSIGLLTNGGALGMLLPAKLLRSLYAGGARRMLLGDCRIEAIEDHSLDQRSIFKADAFTASIVACRSPAGAGHEVQVRMLRRASPPLDFRIAQDDLPLLPGDARAPWLLAPPDAREALRAMQRAAPPLGDSGRWRIRRGAMTGANDVLIFDSADAALGGLARVRRTGDAREWVVERDALRPLLRGSDIRAWHFESRSHVLWMHDEASLRYTAPRRAAGYVAAHGDALAATESARAGAPGALRRLSPDTLLPKVCWHDLARTLHAVAVPDRVPALGARLSLIPLNTVYFIPVATTEEAMLLAAYLNSTPVRAFARAIAERAKDAAFRFFAWTVACLPMPCDLGGAADSPILELSTRAHARGRETAAERTALDMLVADRYGLSAAHRDALTRFDAWLSGAP
jgi:hypothetical protein